MSDKPKRERAEMTITQFPDGESLSTYSQPGQFDGLRVSKTFHTRVTTGRDQIRQDVTFDFAGCSFLTILDYAIGNLGIAYQDTCRSKNPTDWPLLEDEMRASSSKTVLVKDGFAGRKMSSIAAVTKMSDEQLAEILREERKRRGEGFARLLKD